MKHSRRSFYAFGRAEYLFRTRDFTPKPGRPPKIRRALRVYIAHLPAEQTGWLAGARDPDVGKTLALMHRNPAHSWTIASLATEAGVSRLVLAERFRYYLNESPMAISRDGDCN